MVWLANIYVGSVNKQYGQKTGMCGSNHVVRGGKLNYSVVSELSCVVDEHVVHPVDRYMHRLAVLLGPPPLQHIAFCHTDSQ